jgi:nucleotide-binding universal stress UspA family protein
MELKKILVPVDGSDYSTRAVDSAIALASMTNGEILVIHCHRHFPVILGEPYYQKAIDKIIKRSDELLEPYRKILQNSGIPFTDRILEGPAANAICEVAELEKADMIVMGSRGRNELEGLLLGSCTHRVLSMAPCPVLVVR